MPSLLTPEYLWRPRQILRRLSFKQTEHAVPLPLPWNCTITACSAESIGRSIATQGVYDLPITEAIMRLAGSGETSLDIGGNIGYMSLVLALSVGPRGRVFCFEPNPKIIPTLRTNIKNWRSLPIAPIEVATIALSDRDGDGYLAFPAGFEQNWGIASLETNGSMPVSLRRLDSLETGPVGMMKVDVEGHEAAVFSGAEHLLGKKLVRDILFEEHDPYPAASHRILCQHGYHIFRLTRSAWRPLLLPPQASSGLPFLQSNFLATKDPSRAQSRFRAWGWLALSGFRRS